MQSRRIINWFGLVSGILMLALVWLSILTPWWQLQIGSKLATINANPFCTNFGVLGLNFVIPILFAINIGIMVLFSISGVLLIVYSVKPTKSYGKELLCYGYKRPIYTVVGFIVTLIVIAYVIPAIVNVIGQGHVNISTPLFPLIGTSTIQLPTGMLSNSGSGSIQIGVTVTTAFQYTFYLAIVATALAIVARINHRKIAGSTVLPALQPSETILE
jgi:hypothetical protein